MKTYVDTSRISWLLDVCYCRLDLLLSDYGIGCEAKDFTQCKDAATDLMAARPGDCFEAGVAVGLVHGMAQALGIDTAELWENFLHAEKPSLHEMIVDQNVLLGMDDQNDSG